MITDVLKDFILQKIGKLKPASQGWRKRHCPLCITQGHGTDQRNRFGVKFDTYEILAHCFNCGFSAHWEEGSLLSDKFKLLLITIGADDKFIKELEFDIYKETHNIKIVREGDEISDNSRLRSLIDNWPRTELPEGSLSISKWLELGCDDDNLLKVVNYAIERRIFNLDNFYWCPSDDNQLNKRLIIPFYYQNRLVGFTGRYADHNEKELKTTFIPKYHQSRPLDYLYNLDAQEYWERKYVIVVEGVLDAWAINGVSTLGEINQEKINIINRLQKDIIVCPDRDLKGDALVTAAMNNNWAVAYPLWDNSIKDAAQASTKYGRLLTTHSIIDSAISGVNSIRVKQEITKNERTKRTK